MRHVKMLTALAGLGLLAACAGDPYDDDIGEPVDPNVTLEYDDVTDFPRVAETADDWCENRHGMTAYLWRQGPIGDGYAATFTCG